MQSKSKFTMPDGKLIEVGFKSPDDIKGWVEAVGEGRAVYHLHSKSVAHHGQSWFKGQYALAHEVIPDDVGIPAEKEKLQASLGDKRIAAIKAARAIVKAAQSGEAFDLCPLLPEERKGQPKTLTMSELLEARISKAGGMNTEEGKAIFQEWKASATDEQKAEYRGHVAAKLAAMDL